jgi:hypothetical protein
MKRPPEEERTDAADSPTKINCRLARGRDRDAKAGCDCNIGREASGTFRSNASVALGNNQPTHRGHLS